MSRKRRSSFLWQLPTHSPSLHKQCECTGGWRPRSGSGISRGCGVGVHFRAKNGEDGEEESRELFSPFGPAFARFLGGCLAPPGRPCYSCSVTKPSPGRREGASRRVCQKICKIFERGWEGGTGSLASPEGKGQLCFHRMPAPPPGHPTLARLPEAQQEGHAEVTSF